MRNLSAEEDCQIAAAYDFSSLLRPGALRQGSGLKAWFPAHGEEQSVSNHEGQVAPIIMDIGGGKGGLLTQILKKNSTTAGILYDLSHVMPSAQAYLAEHNLEARVECRPGSFFDGVPEGADLYILKRILHDWDDKACIAILQKCAQAMKPGARLLIMEAVVAEGNIRDFAKDVDVELMVLFGGKERTQGEWQAIVDGAGLRLVNILPTPSMLSIIEVMRG
jgi:hypothetical protein